MTCEFVIPCRKIERTKDGTVITGLLHDIGVERGVLPLKFRLSIMMRFAGKPGETADCMIHLMGDTAQSLAHTEVPVKIPPDSDFIDISIFIDVSLPKCQRYTVFLMSPSGPQPMNRTAWFDVREITVH